MDGKANSIYVQVHIERCQMDGKSPSMYKLRRVREPLILMNKCRTGGESLRLSIHRSGTDANLLVYIDKQYIGNLYLCVEGYYIASLCLSLLDKQGEREMWNRKGISIYTQTKNR